MTVVRPEAQCLWAPALDEAVWAAADAVFEPSDEDEAGRWRLAREAPETWPMRWNATSRFLARLTAFRHLGVFPEQAANWAWLERRCREDGSPESLELVRLYRCREPGHGRRTGAKVTHVDASKKAVGWARENGGRFGADIRWICEDARKWVAREVKRGSTYDGIVLDPPKYGRGPAGEVWRLNEDLPTLIRRLRPLC